MYERKEEDSGSTHQTDNINISFPLPQTSQIPLDGLDHTLKQNRHFKKKKKNKHDSSLHSYTSYFESDDA